MTKHEYVSAYTMIKQIYQKPLSFDFLWYPCVIISIVFTGGIYFGNKTNISIILSFVFIGFYFLIYTPSVVNAKFERAINILDKYYDQGKSIDEFWEDDSLVPLKFFPNKK